MAITENLFYTDYEPKSQNRFIFSFNDADIPAYLVKSGSRPNATSTRKEIDYINTKRYYAGKYAWETMDVTFQDPIVPSGAQKVMEWFRQHYEFSTGAAGYATAYKKDVNLEMLGPDGTIVERWTLKGTFIETANFNELDYSTDDLMDITVTLSFDYATLEF